MEPFVSAGPEIDVEKIMDSIQKKIAEKVESGSLRARDVQEIQDMELRPLPDFLEIPNVYEPHLFPDNAAPYTYAGRPKIQAPPQKHLSPESDIQETGLAKTALKRIRGLFYPLIRFMTRPMYLELKGAVIAVHNASIDAQTAIIDLNNALVDTGYSLQQQIHRMDITLNQSKDYITLLHNALSNMIAEASKLKIEEELLKTRIKVLEDKIEFLENRQRAVEKKLFPA